MECGLWNASEMLSPESFSMCCSKGSNEPVRPDKLPPLRKAAAEPRYCQGKTEEAIDFVRKNLVFPLGWPQKSGYCARPKLSTPSPRQSCYAGIACYIFLLSFALFFLLIGCYCPNGHAAIYIFWIAPCCCSIHHSLWPFDWSSNWWWWGFGSCQRHQ